MAASITMSETLKVGVGGFGAIGMPVARQLDVGIPGLELSAVSAHDKQRARECVAGFTRAVPVVELEQLAELADVVVECAPAGLFNRVAERSIEAGRTLVAMSVGALISQFSIVDRARETGARIVVPTGGLAGLDALRACAEASIRSVKLVTRKPPSGLAGAPYLEERGISLDGLESPLRVFAGNVREAAAGFPANINVGAALSLAGIGPDRTEVEIWADTTVSRNTHRILVDGDAARLDITVEGVPTLDNPRTGRLAPLSAIATLRSLVGPLKVGT